MAVRASSAAMTTDRLDFLALLAEAKRRLN
jgi:hypothetical protein